MYKEWFFFKICCSHLCLRKTKFKRVQLAWIPKCLPPNFFSRESLLFWVFFVHPFFQKNSTRLRLNCLNIAKRYFDIILTMILGRWSVPFLHVVQFFFVEVRIGPCFISSMNLAWGLTQLIWSLPARVSQCKTYLQSLWSY